MAEQDVLVATAQLSDHEKKRKLEDLETDAPEPPPSGVDSLSKTDGDAGEDGSSDGKEEEGDDSEMKRPRLEDHHVDAQVNGYSELEKPEEENVGEKLATISGNINLEVGNGQEQAPVTVGGLAESCQPSDGVENPSTENEKPNTDNCDEKEESRGQIEPASEGNESSNQHELRGPDSETITRKIEVPNNKVGVLIGKAGDTIRFLQYNSGAKIQIMRDTEADPRAATRPVELIGTGESINKAEKLINDVIAEADAGGSPSLVARGFSTVQTVIGDEVEIQVPNEKVGLIIGKGGETIKNLQTASGARIQLVPQHLPAGDQSKERTVRVTGDRKQIEIAREMIKDVMNQPVRPSPLSGVGYHQPAFRPRGPVPSQWGNRGQQGQYAGYDYQQRGPYPSQNPQYPASQYGNYSQPPPRSSYGPSWDQRPPAAMHGQPPQASYNYGQPHGPEYGQPTPYSHAPAQSYGPGYTEMKYESQMASQHSYGGPGAPQSTGYPQGTAAHLGYGPQDQYGRPGAYGMPPQGPHVQTYGQPRASQEMPYVVPASAQPYGSNVPPQQNYGYTSSGPVQQSYPHYGSGPANDGYNHLNATAAAPVYPQPGGQPVAGYGETAGQQPSAYGAGGYGSYPPQAGYAEQPAAATNTGYGYQASGEAAYPGGSGTYGAPAAGQQGYAQQPPPTQPGYDQTNTQTGAYGTASAPQPGYGKSASPQPGYPPQYDSSQVYAAPPR